MRARGSCSSCARTSCASPRPRRPSSSTTACGLGLDAADIELLVARTEGWPAGIYLAALSLAAADDKHALVAAFDGTSAHVVDFLAGEVLAAHPPELQRFMLRTVGARAPVRAALRRRPGRAGRRREARRRSARTNLFLLPLDDRRRWFRFHHLFAQILRVELERREPSSSTELHRRAYAWHGEFGTTDEAIHHAVAARAFPEASRLITETWVHYANAGRIESVNEWLAHVPDAGDQRLLLAKAWVSALRGSELDMRSAAATARALGGLDDGPLPDGFASVESSLGRARGDVRLGRRHARSSPTARASEQLEPPDSPWRPVITWALGWAHYCNGDLDAAERWLTETTRIAPAAEQWIVGVAAIADLSLIAGMRGRRAEQLRLALEAVEVTRTVRAARRRRGRRGAHRLRRRAGRPRAARRGAAPRSRKASSCAGCGRRSSTWSTG